MVILLMILLHIIDDFVLQPVCLSKLKQKSWWEKNVYPDMDEKARELYKNDYKAALFVHSVSWSIMVMLPFICMEFLSFLKIGIHNDMHEGLILAAVIINAFIHYYVDDIKANKGTINLSFDQYIHFSQVIITGCIMSAIYF